MTRPYASGVRTFAAIYNDLVDGIRENTNLLVRRFSEPRASYPKYPVVEVVPVDMSFIEDMVLEQFLASVRFSVLIALTAKDAGASNIYTYLSSVLDAISALDEKYNVKVEAIEFQEDVLSTPVVHAARISVVIDGEIS